jgi:anti-sigma factor RsiW
MMECSDYRLQTSMFIDDELPEADRRPLFRHLGECDSCWTYFRRIERLHGALAEVPRSSSSWPVRPLLQRHITIPVASVVLTVFLALLAGILMTLSVVVSDRSIDGSLYRVPEYRPPQAALSTPVKGMKP